MRIKLPSNVPPTVPVDKQHIMLISHMHHDVLVQRLATIDAPFTVMDPVTMPISIEFLHHVALGTAANAQFEKEFLGKISTYWVGFQQVTVHNLVSTAIVEDFEKALQQIRWSCLSDFVMEKEAAQARGDILYHAGHYAEALHVWRSVLVLDKIVDSKSSLDFYEFFSQAEKPVMERYHRAQFYLNLKAADASLRLAKECTDVAKASFYASQAGESARVAVRHGNGAKYIPNLDTSRFPRTDAEIGTAYHRLAQAYVFLQDWQAAGDAIRGAKSCLREDPDIQRFYNEIAVNGGFDFYDDGDDNDFEDWTGNVSD